MPVDYQATEFLPPDWALVGIPRSNGRVWLLASKELNYAELRAEALREEIWWDALTYLGDRVRSLDIRLAVHLRNFIIIDAPDYESAFKGLFEQWKPERAKRPAIEKRQRKIESPPPREIGKGRRS